MALAIVPAAARCGAVERVSVASDGTQGDWEGGDGEIGYRVCAISADGRYVAFQTPAANLVAGDTNGVSDVFVRDRVAGTTERVSVAADGSQMDVDDNTDPAISADGRFVAFHAEASTLVPGDTNGVRDVFVVDRVAHTIERVSVASDGSQGNNHSWSPSLSADGRYVAFHSYASNLVSGDTSGGDIFVRDRQTGTTERVNVASSGAQGNGESILAAITPDGRYVAFASTASNLVEGDTNDRRDIFVRDRDTNTTERVSVLQDGTQGDADSSEPSISADGRFVAFHSSASNLVPDDTNYWLDIFVADRQTGALELASVAWDGAQSDRDCYRASISADGRFVAFHTQAGSLALGDTSGTSDVFVCDRARRIVQCLSTAADGTQGNNGSWYPHVCADGRSVAFLSHASNLVPDDTNARFDIFVAALPTDPPTATDDAVAVDEDSAQNPIYVLDNDSDPQGGALTIVAVSQPARGLAAIAGDHIEYTPDAGFPNPDDSGHVTFRYLIANPTCGTHAATVTVTVNNVNDPPDAVDDTAWVLKDSSANALDVLGNDRDVDGDSFAITGVTSPAHGTAAIEGDRVHYTPDLGYPDPDDIGHDSFQYTISDGLGGTGTATVRVTVGTPPNPAGGTLYAWGTNWDGELGFRPPPSEAYEPVLVQNLTDVVAVSAGGIAVPMPAAFSLALRADRTVWAWGANSVGQLGVDTPFASSEPLRVPGVAGVVAISAGDEHVLALLGDGTVWAWGKNEHGELGDNTTTSRWEPRPVYTITDAVAIAAGHERSFAVRADGTLWAWGENDRGALGIGWQGDQHLPVQVHLLTDVVAVAAGDGHALALRRNGTVWTWGSATNGPLGPRPFGIDERWPFQMEGVTGAVAIAAGGYHSLALNSDGTVWAWGSNSSGQLGDNSTVSPRGPGPVDLLANVVAIAAGGSQSFAVDASGTAWAWGANNFGQLGDGTTTRRLQPVQVHVLASATALDGAIHHALGLVGAPQLPRSPPAAVWATDGLYDDKVRVTWSAHPDASSYELWRHTADDPAAATRIADALSSAWYDDFAVAAGATHYYWVKARNAHGASDFSASDDGYRNALAAPTGVAASDGTFPDKVRITWDTVPAATSYEVWRHTAHSSGQAILLAASVPDATYDDSLAEPLVTYYYWVRARSGVDASPLSDPDAGFCHAGAATVCAWGRNDDGQLGDASTTDRYEPVGVHNLTGVVALAGGSRHSVALLSDGSVWAWGANGEGQLGDNTQIKRREPVQMHNLSDVAAVAARGSFTLALRSDGTVWACGHNDHGQLGDGTTERRFLPVQVHGLTSIAAIAGGSYHGLALKDDGTVWAWGRNDDGQLGDGSTTERLEPVAVGGLAGVTAVAAGSDHSIALKNDGTAWTWGGNGSGQLGDNSTTDRHVPGQVNNLADATAIACCSYACYALRSNGTVWAWGSNSCGKLGDGTTTERHEPTQVHNLADVTAIAGGGGHPLALRSDGTVWAWGTNSDGALGDGTVVHRLEPVQVHCLARVQAIAAGAGHSLAIQGAPNAPPQAADDQATVDAHAAAVAIDVLDNDTDPDGDELTITEVADPPHGTAAITGDHVDYIPDPGYLGTDSFTYTISDGNDGTDTATVTVTVRDPQSVGHTLWAWGQNASGELGSGGGGSSLVPIQVAGLADVRVAAAGSHHSLAATADGTPWAWGLNSDGQLGDGTTDTRPTPGQVSNLGSVQAVAAGFIHSAALLADGTVWTWGDNSAGQLGDGTTTTRHAPVQVAGLAGVRAVEAGVAHTAAVKNDGTVWAWGYNAVGQLGDGTTTDRPTPAQVVGLGSARAVAAGFAHTLALRRDGTVWAWGQNSHGQLGSAVGDQHAPLRVPGVAHAIAVAARGNHSAALLSGGTVVAWGDNADGQLGDGTTIGRSTPAPVATLDDAQAIAAGRHHMAALRSDGTVWAWGANSLGQLGDGTGVDRHTPVQASLLSRVVALAAGRDHTLAVEGLAGQAALTLAAIGNGTVGASPDRRVHATGSTVTLTPEPAAGWRFHHWEGDLAGSDNPAALLMDSHKTVVAVFVEVVELPLAEGWNLVSLPVEPVDPARDAVFPPAVAQAVWQYDNPGGYVVPAEVHTKKGFWVLAVAATTLEIPGTRPLDTSVAVSHGWNLIGVVSPTPGIPQPAPGNPPAAALWVYDNPGGYRVPGECAEKQGMWVLATEAATLW